MGRFCFVFCLHMHYSGRWCGHAYAVGRRTRLHFWCAHACGSNGPNERCCLCMWFWCAYACGSNGPNGLGCLCMWLQRFFLRRLGWYAYAVRSCICPRVTLDKKVPTFLLCICRALAAYARGSPSTKKFQLFCYAYAVP